jgi:hypothetical protein
MNSINNSGARHSILDVRIGRKTIIYIQLLYVLVVFWGISLGLPYAAVYFLDILNVVAILFSLKGCRGLFSRISYWPKRIFVFLCIMLVFTDILNAVSPLLIVWAVRNTFRFFGFFLACVTLLTLSDVSKIMKMFYVFQMINCIISIYQFFVLGLKQDNLGGIFGTSAGCNGYSNLFFCFLLAYYGLYCLSGKEPIRKFLFICVSTLALAALAEIKFFFFEFIAIVIVVCLLNMKRVRTYGTALLIVAIFFIALQVFANVFPSSYATISNFDSLFGYSSKSMAGYELSRFGAFGEINTLIFNGDPIKELFGIGFGGAEYSSTIPMFTSNFYRMWGYLNYRWFTHQMWYIESGAVGFTTLVLLFVSHMIYSGKLVAKAPQYKVLLQFAVISTAVTIFNLWYNCTLRIEAGYINFFVLAISCIVAKEVMMYEDGGKKSGSRK